MSNATAMQAAFQTFLRSLTPAEQQQALAKAQSVCAAINNGDGAVAMLQSTATPGAGGACPMPGNGFTPSVQIPGCPTNCDPCLFPQIETDLSLYSWPEIEAQMWDTDTKINTLLVGALPLAAGGSVTLEQEARRSLSWVPDCVKIATTWNGTPQPGLLTYQWAVGPKTSVIGQIQFSNPLTGTQFECGDNCDKVPFPTYKGCDNIKIGSLSSLRLIVTLAGTATSTVTGIDVVVYHRKLKKACCSSCAAGGSCNCG